MAIENEPWWPELVALKDTMSLRDLAARFGVGVGALSVALRNTGTARLAALPAGVTGVSPVARPAVAPAVAVAPSQTPAETVAPTVAAAPKASAPMLWSVVFRGDARPRAVIASSFADALARAVPLGEVVAVRRLGEALA
jgi:hypothetical protein